MTEDIHGAHPKLLDYPLYVGDLLTKDQDGTWTKQAPGMGVSMFKLTSEQEAKLQPVTFENDGLNFRLV